MFLSKPNFVCAAFLLLSMFILIPIQIEALFIRKEYLATIRPSMNASASRMPIIRALSALSVAAARIVLAQRGKAG